ncbi:hypothetical protein MSG28_002675 [Choristoneura fumiferana]|uniref:Uncharacterized protein n=1 Tax=Choristoneura fumiferana TaxID=7141 RepID=A0ACC0JJN1_CHOFU|nr:hypothetical protein MSG28_002675 [Choristoneura fumiferana]
MGFKALGPQGTTGSRHRTLYVKVFGISDAILALLQVSRRGKQPACQCRCKECQFGMSSTKIAPWDHGGGAATTCSSRSSRAQRAQLVGQTYLPSSRSCSALSKSTEQSAVLPDNYLTLKLSIKWRILSKKAGNGPLVEYLVGTVVLENGRALLYWDRSVITDRTIVANKPDIVLTDRSNRQAVLVDVTIPHDENLVKAEKDKLSKYLDLAHEVTAMWDVDSTIIVPIVVSANGLIAKSLDQHLKRLSLDGWIKGQIQKAVLLDTARIVRRFLTLRP